MSFSNLPLFRSFLIFMLTSQNFCLASKVGKEEDTAKYFPLKIPPNTYESGSSPKILTPAKKLNIIKSKNENESEPNPNELITFFKGHKSCFSNYKTLEKRINNLMDTYNQNGEQNPHYYFGTICQILESKIKHKP